MEYPVEGARAVHNAIFGQATDLRIWLRDIQCHGSEEQITDCMIPPWGEVGGCVHAYDASVICKVGKFIKLSSRCLVMIHYVSEFVKSICSANICSYVRVSCLYMLLIPMFPMTNRFYRIYQW